MSRTNLKKRSIATGHTDPPSAKRRAIPSSSIVIDLSSSPEPEPQPIGDPQRCTKCAGANSPREVGVATARPSASKVPVLRRPALNTTGKSSQKSSIRASNAPGLRPLPGMSTVAGPPVSSTNLSNRTTNIIEISDSEDENDLPHEGRDITRRQRPTSEGAGHQEGHPMPTGRKPKGKGKEEQTHLANEDPTDIDRPTSEDTGHREGHSMSTGRMPMGKGEEAQAHATNEDGTSTFDINEWSYSLQDLDATQLEALSIVASAEAGVGIEANEPTNSGAAPTQGQGAERALPKGESLGVKHDPGALDDTLGQSIPRQHIGRDESGAVVTLHSDNAQRRDNHLLDEDGDTIMADAAAVASGSPLVDETDPVAAILELVPDLDEARAKDLVDIYSPQGSRIVEVVLDAVFGAVEHDTAQPEQPPEGGAGSGLPSSEATPDIDKVSSLPECQCCFEKHSPDQTVRCPNDHPFCLSCIRQYAERQLGVQVPDLPCMHQGGCVAPFELPQLRLALPESLFSLLERMKQRQELKNAQLEGFEECPFCDWGCVMDPLPTDESARFQCGNEGVCGKVSCRRCRKVDHLPRPCGDVGAEQNSRLAIEEAMTMAIIRTCPNCPQVAFVKEEGCNKMVCPQCRSLSCYICKAQISGYDHFNANNPLSPCVLFDTIDTEERHANEANEAYEDAMRKLGGI